MYFTKCVFVFLLTLYSMSLYVCLWAAKDEDGFPTYTKDDYPNPMDPKDTAHCARSEPGMFCNPELKYFIKHTEASQIDEILRRIQNDTGCICEHGCPEDKNGLSLGVALLKAVDKDSLNNLNDYADHLLKKWALGSCDNGVLVLIVVSKGKIVVAMGEKANNALGSGFFDKINNDESRNIRNETALFRSLERLLESYYAKIKGLNLNKESGKSTLPNVILLAGLVFGAICLFICVIGIIYHIATRRKRRTRTVNQENQPNNNGCCYCIFEALCCCL